MMTRMASTTMKTTSTICETDWRPEGTYAVSPLQPPASSPQLDSRSAVTLVELLTVIVIVTLLMTFLVVSLAGLRQRAREKATTQQLAFFATAIEQFKADWGVYPPDRIDQVLTVTGCGAPIDVPAGYYSDREAEDNEGIKALYIALTCPKKNGPYIDADAIPARDLDPEHVYYAQRAAIVEENDGGQCDTDAESGTDDIQAVDGPTPGPAGNADKNQVLIDAGPNGYLETDSGDSTDVIVLADPIPIKVLVDGWGNDLHYDRLTTADDNQAAASPNPTSAESAAAVGNYSGSIRHASGDSHMLRNVSGYDLWSNGANGVDECQDDANETDPANRDADDGDDVTNWDLTVYGGS